MSPPGARIARWYCRREPCTFSLLPDCLAARLCGPNRYAILAIRAAIGLLLLAIGISRIYLGVHWTSDVLGGYLMGGLALYAVIKASEAAKLKQINESAGEAAAILAGDALLTLAFEVLARMRRPAPSPHAAIIRELAAAVGTRGGMIAGQMADLEAEGRRVSARQLEAIHRGKTGALIRASVRTGALFAGADGLSLQRLSRFGAKLGLAFQIVDDVLDVRSSTRRLGKTTHKDAALGKATYPAVHGLEKSQRMAGKLVEEACADLKPFGRRADTLREIARYLLTRAA
ncbi:MAG: polyprenyl synthetase family protein [Acidobacteria bacterium]|nr:polyprenyl synthetase family protein [Acidobacteriota bacterium]